MKPRYTLAPEAARDLVEIWIYLKQQASLAMASMWNPSSGRGLSFWQKILVLACCPPALSNQRTEHGVHLASGSVAPEKTR